MSKPKIRCMDASPESDEPARVVEIMGSSPEVKVVDAIALCEWVSLPNHIVKVYAHQGRVIGYCSYILQRSYVQLYDITIDPKHVREGYGTKLVQHLQDSLRNLRRRIIAVQVEVNNLPAQLFFKEMGFCWFRTLFKGTPKEAYVMKYTYRGI